jgi:hypothetical protein|tara:strand:+ start:140 stop:442 length:303 start_codon:yes stop_codon:yes gene_type:complete
MATTINADVATGGAIVTGDTSGILGLQAKGVTLVTVGGKTVAMGTAVGLTADSATLGGLSYPTSDGTNGQAILTNGSGTLTFGAAGISTGKAIAMAIVFG